MMDEEPKEGTPSAEKAVSISRPGSPKLDEQSTSLLPHSPDVEQRCCNGSWRFWFGLGCSSVAAIGLVLALVAYAVVNKQGSVKGGWGVARPLTVLDKPLVILISSDGFRWGYNWKAPTPNINRLRLNGTEAEAGMIPVFPTKTFPNHYSIATGLYPAWHGIIGNTFRDPASTDKFFVGNRDPKWWLGEPIWETVVRSGLQAATVFWPGSDVVRGLWKCETLYCRNYNGSVPYEERVDSVLSYIDMSPVDRPSLITLYFEAPDQPGHDTGPDAPQITDAVVRIDAMIGRLLDGLDRRGVLEDVTVILVGDHGMVGNCEKKMIYLEDLAPWSQIPAEWVDTYSPVLAIRPPPNVNAADVVFNMTQGLASGKVHNAEFLQVYLKGNLPSRLHYSESSRIQPIIGMIAEAYTVASKRSETPECGGSHGYDNAFLSMRTIFIGTGPQFARGRKVPSFELIELYHVMASILGLDAAPNNGTISFAESLILPRH